MEDKDLEIIAYMRAFSQDMESNDQYETYAGYSVSALMIDGVDLIERLEAERKRFDNYYRAVSMAFRASQMREMRGSFSHEDFDEMINKLCGGTNPDAKIIRQGDLL